MSFFVKLESEIKKSKLSRNVQYHTLAFSLEFQVTLMVWSVTLLFIPLMANNSEELNVTLFDFSNLLGTAALPIKVKIYFYIFEWIKSKANYSHCSCHSLNIKYMPDDVMSSA